MSDEAVKVAVRVRPFNKRELDRKAKCIIRMQGPTTTITNPENDKEHTFTFDYSYWSHDDSQKRHTQQDVYNDLGKLVLEGAWAGYNATLFAYGQTGSGKSYSMVGYGEDKGIIPLACEEIFQRIESNTDENLKYKVEASMIEIYNEQVKDLFNPSSYKPGGLRVRENPKTGPYVEDLCISPVKTYKDIEHLMEIGTKARTVGATLMNQTSSRAHTLFQIILTQTTIRKEDMKATDKVSKITLVDLAGSERAGDTGATGDRLKEGAAINKSLSALGNVISALVKRCKAKTPAAKKKIFIPYRDSTLTWLMKESLGGNAKTIMIAALSPADINYEETLSTLKYADRAKQIKNKAVVNEDPNVTIIKELKAEIERLKKQLEGKSLEAVPGAIVDPEAERKRMEEFERLKEELLESQKIIAQLQMSDEEKEKKYKELAKNRDAMLADVTVDVETTAPRLTNLHPDPLMNGRLVYILEEGETTIGRRTKEFNPKIKLGAANILPQHCVIERQGDTVTLKPNEGAATYVNGDQVKEPVTLRHKDRIILGSNSSFLYLHENDLDNMSEEEKANLPDNIDYNFVQEEYASKLGFAITIQNDEKERELEQRMKELEEKMKKEKEAQLENERRRRELEEKEKKMMEELKAKELALKKLAQNSPNMEKLKLQIEQQQREAEEALRKEREELENKRIQLEREMQRQLELAKHLEARKVREKRDRDLLDEKLVKVIPMVNEANAIAKELNRDVFFDIKLFTYITEDPKTRKPETKTEIGLNVYDRESNTSVLWSFDKFVDRFYIIQELYQHFINLEESEPFVIDKENDPFWDPVVGYSLIGISMLYLKPLAHFMDMELWTPIFNSKGETRGELFVGIYPLDKDGNIVKDDFITDPFSLVDSSLEFKLIIECARGLPVNIGSGVYIQYRIDMFETGTLETERDNRRTTCPSFRYEKVFKIDKVTEEVVYFLLENAIKFDIYGKEIGVSDLSSRPSSRAGTPISSPPGTIRGFRSRNFEEIKA